MAANTASTSGLATRYATALFELARERKQLDQVAADLDRLQAMLDESADLARLIASPIVSREEQGQAIVRVAEDAGLSELTRGFLGVLARQRRLGTLPGMIKAFQEMLAEQRGQMMAEITSAAPLRQEDLDRLGSSIAQFAGKEVRLSTTVDPNLIAGIVVRVGSRMIDASMRTKLQQLEMSMKGVG